MAHLNSLDLISLGDAQINDIECRVAGIALTDDRKDRRGVPGGEECPVC
jgi:hypothetical protein